MTYNSILKDQKSPVIGFTYSVDERMPLHTTLLSKFLMPKYLQNVRKGEGQKGIEPYNLTPKIRLSDTSTCVVKQMWIMDAVRLVMIVHQQ